MKLHLNKKRLEEALRATALKRALPIEYVEKDYWITYALKVLAQSNLAEFIVFKGGTSLSKAYHLISRFSEDIDIAVLTAGLSNNQAKNKVKKISKIISKVFDEIESPDTSINSHYRKIRFAYPQSDPAHSMVGQITDSLLLEVNAFAEPEPYKIMSITCYVAEFLLEEGHNNTVIEFGLEAFKMKVLSTQRTICEKVMCLIKASYGTNHIEQIKHKIRHLYDIYFLMTDESTRNFIHSKDFIPLIKKVIECDKNALTQTPWLKQPLSNACIFSSLKDIWPALEGTYQGDFKAMVVGDIPSLEALLQPVKVIHQQLKKVDKTINY